MLTYRQLREALAHLTDEQLDCHVGVYSADDDEHWSANSLCAVLETDVLDEGSPVLVFAQETEPASETIPENMKVLAWDHLSPEGEKALAETRAQLQKEIDGQAMEGHGLLARMLAAPTAGPITSARIENWAAAFGALHRVGPAERIEIQHRLGKEFLGKIAK